MFRNFYRNRKLFNPLVWLQGMIIQPNINIGRHDFMTLRGITDYDIQALVDDELGHEEGKEVLSYLEQDSTARKRYNELMKQKNLLKYQYHNGLLKRIFLVKAEKTTNYLNIIWSIIPMLYCKVL